MSSSEDGENSSWTDVVRGDRRRGRGGKQLQKMQQKDLQLQNIPGSIGLVSGDRRRQLQQQQQCQGPPGPAGPGGQYPKVVTRRAGFRQVNCCMINLSKVKIGVNKT